MHVTLLPGQEARLADPAMKVWFGGAPVPTAVTCPAAEMVPGVRLVAHHVRHGWLATPEVVGMAGPDRKAYAPTGDVTGAHGWEVVGEHAPHVAEYVTLFHADGTQRQYLPGEMVAVAAL